MGAERAAEQLAGTELWKRARVTLSEHDITLDAFATPEGVVYTERRHPRPKGILWERLDDDKIAAIPVLAAQR